MSCLFIFFVVFFEAQKFSVLIKYNYLFFSFVSSAFGVISFKKALANPRFQKFALIFSSKNIFYI